MNISQIYDEALYLAEKTDDSTGYIDSEYKNQHKKKAEILIRQAIRKLALLENIDIPDADSFELTDNIPMDSYILKNIIPCYVAARLCSDDRENDKYNLLIYEYQYMLQTYKHSEEAYELEEVLEGLI